MTLNRYQIAGLALIAAALAFTLVVYRDLPDPMPTHWDWRGEVDGHMPKRIGAFFGPLLMAGVFLLLAALPRLSPRGYALESFARAYGMIQLAVLAFLFVVFLMTTFSGLGYRVPMDQVMTAAMGALFVVLGNFLGKVTRNFFVGIRTPWTLASEEVWFRTHRFGGKTLVVAGLLIVAGALLEVPFPIAVVLLIAAVIVPIVYSYVIYRQLEREAK